MPTTLGMGTPEEGLRKALGALLRLVRRVSEGLERELPNIVLNLMNSWGGATEKDLVRLTEAVSHPERVSFVFTELKMPTATEPGKVTVECYVKPERPGSVEMRLLFRKHFTPTFAFASKSTDELKH